MGTAPGRLRHLPGAPPGSGSLMLARPARTVRTGDLTSGRGDDDPGPRPRRTESCRRGVNQPAPPERDWARQRALSLPAAQRSIVGLSPGVAARGAVGSRSTMRGSARVSGGGRLNPRRTESVCDGFRDQTTCWREVRRVQAYLIRGELVRDRVRDCRGGLLGVGFRSFRRR